MQENREGYPDAPERRGEDLRGEYGREERPHRRRRKHRAVRWIVVLVLLAAVAFYLLGMNGFGVAGKLGIGGGSASDSTQTSEKKDEMHIVVKEDKVYVDGQEKTMDQMVGMLQKAGVGSHVTLTDEKAIKETYEQVIDLIKEQHVEYTEE